MPKINEFKRRSMFWSWKTSDLEEDVHSAANYQSIRNNRFDKTSPVQLCWLMKDPGRSGHLSLEQAQQNNDNWSILKISRKTGIRKMLMRVIMNEYIQNKWSSRIFIACFPSGIQSGLILIWFGGENKGQEGHFSPLWSFVKDDKRRSPG